MNLKPFDLEKALAGAPVVTRNGKPVEQLVFMDKAAAGEMRLIGVIGEEVVTFTDKGEFNPVSDKPQSWDRFEYIKDIGRHRLHPMTFERVFEHCENYCKEDIRDYNTKYDI